jgi:hypothetical protein
MPAGKRIEPHEAAIIRRYLEETSLTTQAIANKMPPLSKRTIDRLRLNFELFDAPYPPPCAIIGRPKKLTYEQELVGD